MVTFTYNEKTHTVEVRPNAPIADFRAYNTRVCIIPNTCPGCGNCKLCGPGCTCISNQANCNLADHCNARGSCLSPAKCTHQNN